MDLPALLAQGEVVVLVFLLLCFVGLLLIFYITYRALSNLRQELQDQIDVASARLERIERGLAMSDSAALSDTQGARSLDELLDEEPAERYAPPREATEKPAAPKPVPPPEIIQEEAVEPSDRERRSHVDSEELALLEAEAISGQLREGVFGRHEKPAAGIPEDDTDWEGMDLSETSIVFDEADLEDEAEERPKAAGPAPEEDEEHELLIDLSEAGEEISEEGVEPLETEASLDELGEEEDLLLDEGEDEEIAAANEWREPVAEEDELAFSGEIDFEDITEAPEPAAEKSAAVVREQELQLTFDEPAEEEISLTEELIFEEKLEDTAEPIREAAPAAPAAAETPAEELESEISLDELAAEEEAAEEPEDEISLGEELIFEEEFEEPAAEAEKESDELVFGELDEVPPAAPSAAETPAEELESEISLDEFAMEEEAAGELEDEISLGEELIFEEEFEEPAAEAEKESDELVFGELEEVPPAAPSVAETPAEELESKISLDELAVEEEAAGEPEDEISLGEELIFEEEFEEPAAEAEKESDELVFGEFEEVPPAAPPAAETPAEELESEISLDELAVEEEAAGEPEDEISLGEEMIFKDAEPSIVAAPAPVAEAVDEELVFEELSEGLEPEPAETGAHEASLSGGMLLVDEEEQDAAGEPEPVAEPKESKRVVSIEDDDYEFDNPSETMILLDEDMGPKRRAFIEEDDEPEGEAIGGSELFETLEQEGDRDEAFQEAPADMLFWTGDEEAPIYFGDEDEEPAPGPEERAMHVEAPEREENGLAPDTGGMADADTPDIDMVAQQPSAEEQAVLDEQVLEPAAEDLDLDVEMALNETFLEEDLLYLEGLMKDTKEDGAAKAEEKGGRPAGEPGATPGRPSGSNDEDIVFEDIGRMSAREVEAPSVSESSDDLDFTLEEDSIEFDMPSSPEPSATSYMGDDDIYFEDEPEGRPQRPATSYEARVEPLKGGESDLGEDDVDYDMVIDFEGDIAALEDLLDQDKNKSRE